MDKKKILGIVALALAVIAVVAILIVGGSDEKKIVGTWIFNEEKCELDADGVVDCLEFYSDGKGSMDKTSMTWSIEDGKLVVTALEWLTESYGYELKGDELYIINPNGTVGVYDRVKE